MTNNTNDSRKWRARAGERSLLYMLGRPFSPLYAMAMTTRAALYRLDVPFFRTCRAGAPVVSVGNLILGGSGKTPLVLYLARLFLEQGRHPAVISRGHGGAARGAVNVVSSGTEVLLDAAAAGDEPRLLAESLPGVPVLTGRRRPAPARAAVERFGADALILDDGFQHLAMGRDLDLVLFNADTLAGNSRVFPGGDLREPVAALGRCHAFVLSGVDHGNRERAERFAALLGGRFPGRPVFYGRLTVEAVLRQAPGREPEYLPVGAVEGAALFAFCGIAQPDGFRRGLEGLGAKVAGFVAFHDHYPYQERDLRGIEARAVATGAAGLVTTRKDLVKLQRFSPALPLHALVTRVVMDPEFDDFVFKRLFS